MYYQKIKIVAGTALKNILSYMKNFEFTWRIVMEKNIFSYITLKDCNIQYSKLTNILMLQMYNNFAY